MNDRGGSLLYLDASAMVKLVVVEAESAALAAYLRGAGRAVSSAVSRVEVVRAAQVARDDPRVHLRALEVAGTVGLVPVDMDVLVAAASVAPATLRTLDAIHLASALALGGHLAALVAYDRRLADAAADAGVTVVAPT